MQLLYMQSKTPTNKKHAQIKPTPNNTTQNTKTQTNNTNNNNTGQTSVRRLTFLNFNKEFSLSPADSQLFFRVNKEIKEIYSSLTPQQKRIVKLILQAAILSLSGEKEKLQQVAKELGAELAKQDMQPILNINVSVSEAKNTNNVNIDFSKLLDVINKLERLMLTIEQYTWDPKQNAYKIPPARMEELTKLLNELRKLIN